MNRGALLRRHLGDNFPWNDYVNLYFACRNRLLAAGVPLMPGAVDLLDWLDHRGVTKAVATSASRATALVHLQRAGLLHRFATVITRDDVAHCKPDPETFLRAAAELDASPKHCLVIEDSLPGLRSALAAGTRVIWLREAAAIPDLSPRVQIVHNLHHVRALLDGATEPALGCNVQSAA